MNIQLVDSLIEVILNLPSEDQQLFQSKFATKQMIKPALVHRREALTGNVDHFSKWVSQFPKSKANLPDESFRRETIYGDRGR
jgi:hypothetical protein